VYVVNKNFSEIFEAIIEEEVVLNVIVIALLKEKKGQQVFTPVL
jgi:hypothetical protein